MNSKAGFSELNPFVSSSVGEKEIWSDEGDQFCDVQSINQDVFHTLLRDIAEVNATHVTRVRFLLGQAGSGKSHLFSRLRRHLKNEQFTFVPNPPRDPREINRFVLKKVITGLEHPSMDGSRFLPYSQIERLVYALMAKVPDYADCDADQVHAKWLQEKRHRFGRLFEAFHRTLSTMPGIAISLPVQKALFRVLDNEKKWIALQWLSGATSLNEFEYSTLGVSGPLESTEVADLLKQFGLLSKCAGPIVLVFDQLDSLRREDQIAEIEALLIDLRDSSENWYVIVSLLEEKFHLWDRVLSDPFLGKFGTVENGVPVHRVANISSIDNAQQEELLRSRLDSEALRKLREKEHVKDPLHPLGAEALQKLLRLERISPRLLLKDAELAYRVATSRVVPTDAPLLDFLKHTFSDLRSGLADNECGVDTVMIAERVEDLINVLFFSETSGKVSYQEGPLPRQLRNFEGSDRIYGIGDGITVRVVVHDVQERGKFPDVLKKIVDAPPATILVRDGRVRCSGEATQRLLSTFRLDKKFFHLSLDEIKDLHTLGKLLAKMREGDFRSERTQPAPSEENILRSLSRLDNLRTKDISRLLLSFGRTGLTQPSRPHDNGQRAQNKPPSPDLASLVRQIMETEGWLCFERLYYMVYSSGLATVTPRDLSVTLEQEPLSNLVDLYPADPHFPYQNRVIIWNGGM